MALNPLNMLDPQYLMGVLSERQDFGNERSKYIGESLFPRKNFPEQTIAWETVRRENRLAGLYSAKGKAVPGDDIGFKTFFENVVWIKAAKHLDPDIVQKIRDPGMVPVYKEGMSAFAVQGIADRVTSKMREYLTFIDDQLAAQEEYMATQAMQGAFRWPPLGYDRTPVATPMPEWNADEKLEITFPFHAKFVQSMATLEGVPASPGMANRTGTQETWLSSSADPRYDLEVIADMMLDEKGVDAEGATLIMSRKAMSYIAQLASIQRWIVGTNYEAQNADQYANIARVKDWVATNFGYRIKLYDAKWTYLDGTNADGSERIRSVRFIPENKMIVIPPGESIGVMAQAPHETQGGDFVWGKTVYVKRQDVEPYEREVGISNVCWPLLQDPEGIGVFTLW